MRRLRKKILCEDLSIVDISVGTVYVFCFSFFVSPFIRWQFITREGEGGRGEGVWVIICTCRYEQKKQNKKAL